MAFSSGSTNPYKQLIDAVATGDLRCFKEAIAKVDDKELAKTAGLHLTAYEGHLDMCKYLVDELKVDVNDKDGLGHRELLLLLLSKGVNVDAISSVGTPLLRAASHGNHEVVKILLDHHANPNFTVHQDLNVLLAALNAESVQSVELFLEAGADPNTAGSCGVRPLELAAPAREVGMIRCLLKAGADPNVLNEAIREREGGTSMARNHMFETYFTMFEKE